MYSIALQHIRQYEAHSIVLLVAHLDSNQGPKDYEFLVLSGERRTLGKLAGASRSGGLQLGHALQLRCDCLFRQFQIVGRLKIEPVLRRLAEDTSKQKSQLRRDGPCTFDYMGNAHRRNTDDACELGLRQMALLKDFTKELAGINWGQAALDHGNLHLTLLSGTTERFDGRKRPLQGYP